VRFAPAVVALSAREGGGFVLRSPQPLAPFARRVGDWLERWAGEAPARTFLAERDATRGWRRVTYAEAFSAVRAIAQGLLDLGAAPDRPVVLLSENGVDHALVQLAAMHAAIPAAPVSPAYSLVSRDFAKLREIVATVGPGVVFADDPALYANALAAALSGVPLLASRGSANATVSALGSASPGIALDRASASVGPDTIAKILFTSGSTGTPKGVVNTQRMLCSNQQAIAQVWPLLAERPPVVVDWLPWSHTFGGNHNFNMVLASGGTLYIDAGKPAPGRFDETIANLREVSPTLYFNVPRGFERLAAALEEDDSLAQRFFADLDLLFYAAAALPQSTWERLERLAARHRPGRGVPFVSAWGSTETAPLVTSVHFPIDRAGVIGLPAPGVELKLVPAPGAGEKLEMRVRGPNVTPGYWERGGSVRPIALDDEGFLPTGDAGRLADDGAPARGVLFDGRTAENFKLTSGTWVAVGELRVRAITACAPLVQDAVVAGHDRDYVALLVFLSPATVDSVESHLRARLASALRAYNEAHPGSSSRVSRALVVDEPPSIDGGEITDKGYINQRAVLTRRAHLVERLYAEAPDEAVIVLDAGP
jgi:feruloyl-CoA synthase